MLHYAPRSTRWSGTAASEEDGSRRGGLPVYTWRHLTRHSVHTRFHCLSRSLAFLYIHMYRHSWILCKHFWSDFQRRILASVLGNWLNREKTCVCNVQYFPSRDFKQKRLRCLREFFYSVLEMWIFLCTFKMHILTLNIFLNKIFLLGFPQFLDILYRFPYDREKVHKIGKKEGNIIA